MNILIIEDNKEILFGLEKLLKASHFDSHSATNLAKAQKALDQYEYDLIILDWMLPDGSGVDFLANIRKEFFNTAVLLLSSKSEIDDKVEALDAGADDYLAKPFSNIELLARIRALLRRESSFKKSTIELGNFCVDLSTHEVFINKESIVLTKKEFELLELLILNQQVILTRYQINDHLNNDFNNLKSSNLVDVHIKNLRKKLVDADVVIETVRGVGFKFSKHHDL